MRMNLRNKVIVAIFVCAALASYAQYDSEGPNKSRFKAGAGWFFKGWRPHPDNPLKKYDRLIFDINYCDWSGPTIQPFQVSPLSIGFNVNFMADKPFKKKGTFAIGYGLRYSKSNYAINDYLAGSNPLIFNQPAKATRYTLSYHQFSIPLEFRFRKNAWKHFKFYLGGSVGYIVGSSTKLTLGASENETQIKTRKLSAIDPLQYGAHVRIGIRNWALYGAYGFSNLFTSESGLQANTLRIGLSISLF
ncbi:MAG: PorT family protein [Crocinitomicaceae bacterium]|nr:PorT family protein [Crocinitomicaceae bacterium]